jgi:hypothetical protein
MRHRFEFPISHFPKRRRLPRLRDLPAQSTKADESPGQQQQRRAGYDLAVRGAPVAGFCRASGVSRSDLVASRLNHA